MDGSDASSTLKEGGCCRSSAFYRYSLRSTLSTHVNLNVLFQEVSAALCCAGYIQALGIARAEKRRISIDDTS
jgi:hypothetical protein